MMFLRGSFSRYAFLISLSLLLAGCGGDAETKNTDPDGPTGPTGPAYHIGYDTLVVNNVGYVAPQVRYYGPYNVPAGTYLTGLGVALGTGSYTQPNTFQLALYSDAGNTPGTLIVTSATGVWVDATQNEMTTPTTYLAPGDYWVAANAETGTFYVGQGTLLGESNSRYETVATGWGTWPSAATSAVSSTFASHVYMIVAD